MQRSDQGRWRAQVSYSPITEFRLWFAQANKILVGELLVDMVIHGGPGHDGGPGALGYKCRNLSEEGSGPNGPASIYESEPTTPMDAPSTSAIENAQLRNEGATEM